jgi:hypothetical protein
MDIINLIIMFFVVIMVMGGISMAVQSDKEKFGKPRPKDWK